MKTMIQKQLQTYGLNPAHWLIRLMQDQIELVHKGDQDIILRGRFQAGKLTDLELMLN